MGDFRLDWRGDEVKQEVMQRMAQALGEFGLTAEAESKKELRKGHGVETGTLRRSIHTALPGYAWGADDTEPSSSTPELGGEQVEAESNGDRLTVELGSGLNYAMPVHQGHHSFSGYHFLTNGVEKAKARLDSILAKYRLQR